MYNQNYVSYGYWYSAICGMDAAMDAHQILTLRDGAVSITQMALFQYPHPTLTNYPFNKI